MSVIFHKPLQKYIYTFINHSKKWRQNDVMITSFSWRALFLINATATVIDPCINTQSHLFYKYLCKETIHLLDNRVGWNHIAMFHDENHIAIFHFDIVIYYTKWEIFTCLVLRVLFSHSVATLCEHSTWKIRHYKFSASNFPQKLHNDVNLTSVQCVWHHSKLWQGM